jgi:hypothetical protein
MALDGTQRKRLSRNRIKFGMGVFQIEVVDVKGLAAFLVEQGCLDCEDIDDRNDVRKALEVYINDKLPRFNNKRGEEEVPPDFYGVYPKTFL